MTPTPRGTKVSADQVGVCLIGAGVIGNVHALALRSVGALFPSHPSPKLISVVDTNVALAKETANAYGFDTVETDWHRALNDPRVDLVCICTPPAMAPDIAAEAARLGKHVFSEKPLAVSTPEALRMFHACRQANVMTLLGTAYRWLPAVQQLRNLVESGQLGKVHYARATFHIDSAADPDAPFAWRYSKQLAGGGVAADLGYHLIDSLRVVLGEIETVTAVTSRQNHTRPTDSAGGRVEVDVEDAALATSPLRRRRDRLARHQPHRRRPQVHDATRAVRDRGHRGVEP